jgi:hypothetical protein
MAKIMKKAPSIAERESLPGIVLSKTSKSGGEGRERGVAKSTLAAHDVR